MWHTTSCVPQQRSLVLLCMLWLPLTLGLAWHPPAEGAALGARRSAWQRPYLHTLACLMHAVRSFDAGTMPRAHPSPVRIAAVAALLWALGVNAARTIASDTFFWRDARIHRLEANRLLSVIVAGSDLNSLKEESWTSGH
jgi:hypothetical protein